MNIDWDDVVQEAQVSPRGLLSDVLGYADDIELVVVIGLDKQRRIRVGWSGDVEASALRCIGMLEVAKQEIAARICEEDEEQADAQA